MNAEEEQLHLIDEAAAGDVLADLGIVTPGTPVTARALSGGISNIVLAASWAGGRAVIKQSLPKLRVATEWSFDRGRIINERRALEALGRLLGPQAVPAVLGHDDARFLFAMDHAPDGGENYKTQLLRGEVDETTARRVGALLGRVHAGTAEDPAIVRDFADSTPLIQGRVDPYHRTAALANPEVADVVLAEAERLLGTQRCLVLGDWSPKNLVVYPDRVVALDFEVAHLGDPAFDVAFGLTHYVLKAVHLPAHASELRTAGDAFLDGYAAEAGAVAAPDEHVVAELGCLLLARADGKSPAEYLDAPGRDRVRHLAHHVLLDRPQSVRATLDHLMS